MGDCVRRVVSAADVPAAGRVGDCVRQSGEECDRGAGRPHRFGVGWQFEAQQAEGGVEGETAGGVHEAIKGGLSGRGRLGVRNVDEDDDDVDDGRTSSIIIFNITEAEDLDTYTNTHITFTKYITNTHGTSIYIYNKLPIK